MLGENPHTTYTGYVQCESLASLRRINRKSGQSLDCVVLPQTVILYCAIQTCNTMALEALLGLDVSEKFNLTRKLLEEKNYEDESKEYHSTCLALPDLSLDLKSLYDANNPARKIAMKFAKGTTTLSFVYNGGVVVCADSRATGGQFIGSQSVKKIIVINDYLLGTMAGGAADCMYWHRVLAEHCRLFELRNKERISVAAASKVLSNILYNYKG